MNRGNQNFVLFEKMFFYGLLTPFIVFLVGIKDPFIWRDYIVYLNYYNYANSYSFKEIFLNVQDPFFTALNKVLIFFGADFYWVCIWIAIITIYIKFYAFRKINRDFYIFLILYSSLTLGLQDYMQVRVALALSILLFSIYCLKNKILKTLALLLCLLFHVSVIIVIIPYLSYLLLKNRSIFFYVYILIISATLLFLNKLLEGWSRFDQYLDSHQYYNPFASIPLLQIITFLYLFIKYKDKAINLEAYVTITGLSAYYFLYLTPAVATRYMEITTIFFIIYIMNFIDDYFIRISAIFLFFLGIFNLFMKPASFLYNYYLDVISIF